MDYAQEIEARGLVRTNAINEAIISGDSEVQRFYKNSVVFLTGGSGFLGKQLIEKLFRSCELSKLYMLVRSKKGKNIQQRLDDIFHEPVFDSLRKLKPDFTSKIVPIAGDVSELKLGLKQEDWRTLTEEVNVIFHVAATTRFDETLKVATLINVRGTREAMSLGRACKNLKTYVHVSTAYTHATTKTFGNEVAEDFSESPILPETLISMVEAMDQERIEAITPAIIKDWPNTYSFTKTVTEELIRETSSGLPICIVRPGIVISSYSEPSPGWLDVSCVYSASGFIVGVGLGLAHTLYMKYHAVLAMVPCDMVNNAIIAAGRETATNQSKGGNDTRIYTVTTNRRNHLSWRFIINTLQTNCRKLVSPMAFYYIFAHITENKFVYNLLFLLLHFIPAYIADLVCFLMGKERRFGKLVKKMYRMSEVLSFFMINNWIFMDNNLIKLYDSLSPVDQTIFNFDIMSIDMKEFMFLWCIGTRKYILKDGLKDTSYAVYKQKFLKVIHYIFMPLYLYSLWKLVCFVFYIGISLISPVINVF